MDREQQRRRIRLFRNGIVGGSVVGALGVAGMLGITHQSAAASTGTGTTTTTTSTSSTDDSGTSSWSSDSGSLSAGSGSSHATTSGS